jgi:hypothetical protein
MSRPLISLALVMIASPVLAQEPVGCDKFKWTVDRERALLASAKPITAGGEVSQPLGSAVKLGLLPRAEAKLPMEPSRKPRSLESYAGFVSYAAVPQPGVYRITLSEGAWIDVMQDGKEVKSGAFSGVTGCEGIRKSVKFDLAARRFLVEISGSPVRQVSMAITPDEGLPPLH